MENLKGIVGVVDVRNKYILIKGEEGFKPIYVNQEQVERLKVNDVIEYYLKGVEGKRYMMHFTKIYNLGNKVFQGTITRIIEFNDTFNRLFFADGSSVLFNCSETLKVGDKINFKISPKKRIYENINLSIYQILEIVDINDAVSFERDIANYYAGV